jgi:hypothetical protein
MAKLLQESKNMYELVSGDELMDLVSGDEVDALLGADWLEIGAQRRGRGRAGQGAALQRAAVAQAIANKRAMNGAVLKRQEPTKSRRVPLGLNSTGTVAAGANANITARPQSMAFKPERIVVPLSIAPDFTIQDIKVGNQSQPVASGDLAAEAFVQTAFDCQADFDTCQTSQDFVMSVTNISGAARQFRAVIWGRSVAA